MSLPAEPELLAAVTSQSPAAEPSPASEDVSADPSAEMPPPLDDSLSATVPDVSFLRRARRQAFWSRTSVRIVSGLMVTALLLMLGMQWVVQNKDRLALVHPAWAHHLQAICQPLHCTVKPLRRVEALVIDSSTFAKSGPESFRLNFVLKNTSDVPLEAPLLELTLTDLQDKAMLRRVLTPAQFGYASANSLPARAEVAGVVSLSVFNESSRLPAVSASAVAGYRVLVFYP